MSFILVLDQGTSSCRAIVFDAEGRVISIGQRETMQIFPENGWVEHNPSEIWEKQKQTAIEALQKAGLKAKDIAAVGIANQRETTVIWNRKTGEPIYNAIVWQDRRTSGFCDEIEENHRVLIRNKTGLEVDAYFSASKINWILKNVPNARQQAENGELCFGTIDSWLIWKLTGGEKHLTDVSNASRSMIYNIETLEWDVKLLEIFDVPNSILPAVKSSAGIFGVVKDLPELAGVKIAGVAGDQQVALFGQLCWTKGATKCTYGTGCFMLQNTGEQIIESSNKLLSTVAWKIDDSVEYALEGSVFVGGAVVQWLRDGLQVIENSKQIESLANSVQDNGGVYFVPAFAGLGAPHWNQDARGLIIGLTRGTDKAHIARAALESIAFQVADLADAMRRDSGIELQELQVDGGATENDLLMQFQADVLQIPVARSKVTETTALGAAYLAGLTVGVWKSKEELKNQRQPEKIFYPQMSSANVRDLRERWNDAVQRAVNWNA